MISPRIRGANAESLPSWTIGSLPRTSWRLEDWGTVCLELLALTGQRREEVAGLPWEKLDLAQRILTIPKARTKNAKAHIVHLSRQALTVLKRADRRGPLVFSLLGTKYFQHFTHAKRQLD